MKKFFVTLLALCGLAIHANAAEVSELENAVYVEPITLVAGFENALPIRLKATGEVKAVFCDIVIPEGITFVGKVVKSSEFEPSNFDSNQRDNTRMTLGIMTGDNVYPAGDNVIGTLTVAIPEDFPLADCNFQIEKIQIQMNADDSWDEPTEAAVSVVTVSDHLILDEEAASAPGAFEGVDVIVKRTIKANEWGTICLPFEIDLEDLATAFGGEVEAAEFVEYEAGDEGLEVSFEAVEETLEANTPYIIKSSVNVKEFSVDEIDVDPDESAAVAEMTNGKTGNKQIVSGAFIGTLHAGTAIPTTVALKKEKATQDAATLFVSGGKFFYTVEETKPLKAFRGYFAFVDADPNGGSEVKMFVNGLETRIEKLQNNNVVNNGTIYDLTGKQVRNNNLKGIFIQNGKKVVK